MMTQQIFLFPNSKFDRTSADNLNDFEIEDLIGKDLHADKHFQNMFK